MIIIENCAVATVDPAGTEYADGHLVIGDDGRIVAFAVRREAAALVALDDRQAGRLVVQLFPRVEPGACRTLPGSADDVVRCRLRLDGGWPALASGDRDDQQRAETCMAEAQAAALPMSPTARA